MNTKILTRGFAIRKIMLLSIIAIGVIICCMLLVYTARAAEADGGNFNTNDSAVDIRQCLGGENCADATTGSKTLTLDIEQNLILKAPLAITQGGDITDVVINLNGHTITGAAGTGASRNGGDVIKLTGEVNLTVNDGTASQVAAGKLIGGNGYEGNSANPGGAGGDVIEFLSNSAEREWDRDLPIIKIDKGTVVQGGTGGDNDSGNGNVYDGNDEAGDNWDSPANAGAGGNGIVGKNNSEDLPTFFEVDIINGKVIGGEGGDIDCKTVTAANASDSGDGGCGIYFDGGRKYVFVDTYGEVTGGAGGHCNKATAIKGFTRLSYSGDGGDGMYLNCDMGKAAVEDESSRSLVI